MSALLAARRFDAAATATLPLNGLIAACRDLVEDTDFPTVHEWKDRGGKVLGHFQVYFPEELAHAAGMLPVKVRGAPVEMRQADSHFGSYLCSILRSSLEVALDGRLPLDFFVTHPICDAARNLAGVWARNFRYPAQILYLPQNANSAATAGWLREEYARMLAELETIAERKVGADDLRNAIGVFNENRRLLRALYEIKRKTPWLLPVDEAYALLAAGTVLPREEHNVLLRAALPQIAARQGKEQDRVRIVLVGGFCEQPPLDLLGVIGQSCYVVDDDLLVGLRYLTSDVPLTDDPLGALAEAYLERSAWSPVQHDERKPKEEMLLEQIRASGATAAIIGAAKMCEPGLDEQVAYSRALDDAQIPYFVTEFEEKMSGFDQLQIQLETFVESILFD